jgi:pyoverdine/dityrosine biosynthesis protein Dit1
VVEFITRGELVHFILPGYPAKSPSVKKVLGPLPDMAERLSLAYLQNVCDQIRAIYPPGARITICSDGLVFADLVRVPDDQVMAYAREVRTLIRDLSARSLSHTSLEEIIDMAADPETLRRSLIDRYGEPPEQVRERVFADSGLTSLFNGIHRFLFEDLIVVTPGRSRNAVRNECKQLAYGMIRRGLAWSALLKERFAGAVRLSIHPHPSHGEKLGIRLIESADSWATPWHAVAVDVGGRFRFMKRSEAEELGGKLVWREGRPSHFILPTAASTPGRAAGPSAA